MDWYKRNPFFYSVLAVLVVMAVGGLWLLSGERSRLSQLVAEYEQKNRVLESLLTRRPSPTNGNVEVLEQNYATLHQQYRKAIGALKLDAYEKEIFFEPYPRNHNDAFFELARFVEEARRLAAGNGIVIPEDYRFGFRAYANEGPRAEQIEKCHKQMKVMRVLAQWLFDSGIRELLGVQREAENSEGQARPRSDSEFSADVFLPGKTSVDEAGEAIEGEAFRVAFKGQSASLRNFLNRVTHSSLPFVVVGIEARLAEEAVSSSRESLSSNPFFPEPTDEAIEASRVPIISDNESLFVVTLEFLELKEAFQSPVAFAGAEGENDV